MGRLIKNVELTGAKLRHTLFTRRVPLGEWKKKSCEQTTPSPSNHTNPSPQQKPLSFSPQAIFRVSCFFPCPPGLLDEQTYRNKKLSLNHLQQCSSSISTVPGSSRPYMFVFLPCVLLVRVQLTSGIFFLPHFSIIKAFLLGSRL